jgi:hypothetical protein
VEHAWILDWIGHVILHDIIKSRRTLGEFTVGAIFLFVNKNNQVMGLLFLQNKDIAQTRFNLVCGINTCL